MHASQTYLNRRRSIETYFDRTAVQAWSRLMSDAPVGRIRATVRAGRDRMRETLMAQLPADLRGWRVLDAGCGTGLLAVEAARRGAHVIAVDLSPTLVRLGQDRLPESLGDGRIEFKVGDFLDPSLGTFDAVVAMDSLIHYPVTEVADALSALAPRTGSRLVFTFAPRTAMLSAMHAVGRFFPRGDRSPAIEPVSERALAQALVGRSTLGNWQLQPSVRIASGFYISQAACLVRQD